MQQEAAASDLIVVNHHLFFADLAVKQTDFGGVIPDYEAVIFDEAHEIEDVAGQYFGITVSNHQVADLVRDINATARRKDFGSTELDRTLVALSDAADRFFAHFPPFEGRQGFADHAGFIRRHRECYDDLLLGLELLGVHLQLVKDQPEEIIPLFRRTEDYRARLKYWMEAPEKDHRLLDRTPWTRRLLQATPIDVSTMLREMLFDRIPAIVLTSATLAVGGNFEFLEKRLGLTLNRSLVVEGSFDYQTQALLYVPQDLPDPRTARLLPRRRRRNSGTPQAQ